MKTLEKLRRFSGFGGTAGGEVQFIQNKFSGNFEMGVLKTRGAGAGNSESLWRQTLYCSCEVAVFRYEGDPQTLIEKGKRNGWPQLSLNPESSAF